MGEQLHFRKDLKKSTIFKIMHKIFFVKANNA
jgi:hypothetical protein